MTTHTSRATGHTSGSRLRATAALAALLVPLTLGLGACSAGESDHTTQDTSSESGAEAMTGAPAPADQALTDADMTGLDVDSSDPGESTSARSKDMVARPPAVERSVISTGTVSLSADDVAKARQSVQRIADAHGGEITEDDTQTDTEGSASYSRLVLRVPVEKFDAAITALEDSADLRASNRSSDDVTTEVIDTDVRVRAQEASLRRVEVLLDRAASLKDIVWIESQLTQRQSELDSLKSQQAYLADQTAESTITVDISRTERDSAPEDDDNGFVAGFTGGFDALQASGVALATVAGALLPFALVLALFGVPVVWVVRRSLRRRRTPVVSAG